MNPEGRSVVGLLTFVGLAVLLAVPIDFGSKPAVLRRQHDLSQFLQQRSLATYRVEVNDTLSQIAHRYGLRRDALLAANPELRDRPNRLEIHEVLQLPLGSSD